jgi:hypothetical protein
MKKVTKLVLMFGLFLSGALCYAHGVARTEKKGDSVPIQLIESSSMSSFDKSGSIVPTLNGHVLTVVFTENLGQVSIEIITASGASVEYLWVYTPNGIQTYLPLNGDYIITFTLPSGDVYYGEFTVTD